MGVIMTVHYLTIAPATRQDDVIKLFMHTFASSHKSIARCPFPIDKIYCYIYVSDDLDHAELLVRATPMPNAKPPDVELTIYQDIATIPLMNNALVQSKTM